MVAAVALGTVLIPAVVAAQDAPPAEPTIDSSTQAPGSTTPPPTTAPPTTAPPTTAPPTTAPPTTAPPTTAPSTTAPTTTSAATTSVTTSSTTTTTVAEPDDDAAATTTATTTSTSTTTTTPPPPQPVGLDVRVLPDRLQHILATIRYLESRNTYDIPPNKGNASGAYQFIESTWNNYGGYRHAYLAPPEVQDARAAEDVQMFLDRFAGDVSMVPVMWYYPRAFREPELMDVVPYPQHGNVLTIREYQARWLEVFAQMSGEDLPPILASSGLERRNGSAPQLTASTERLVVGDDGRVVLASSAALDTDLGSLPPMLTYPVLGPSRLASFDCASDTADEVSGTRTIDLGVDGIIDVEPIVRSVDEVEAAGLCVTNAPGVVFGVKLQPVLAAADGIVTAIDDQPGSGRPISLTITAPDGMSIEYRGFNDDTPGTDDGDAPDHLRLSPLAQIGGVVRAGQIIGFMGDSDPLPPSIRADVPTDSTIQLDPNATAPHVRLTITGARGEPIDAVGPLLDARARETCRVGIGGWSIPPADGVFDEVTIETTDLHDDVDSEWVITRTGQVLATGWAAMINPGAECDFVPADPYGSGANGSIDWLDHWLQPYSLATKLWVDLALRDEDDLPGAFVLPG